ncbi:MAG: complex I subunit 5 family protein [Gammaproteobacteria bacterium]
MNTVMLLLIWLLPLALALLARQRHARWLIIVAALPALIAATVLPVGTHVSLPWLLLGVELGLDETGRVFLLFSGLLWLLASLVAVGSLMGDANSTRFRFFFLLAMSGNLGLIVAQDMVSFYLGFTLMGLAAYGLIAHSASLRARRAARRYLGWTIAGELILFVAITMLAQQHGGDLSFSVLQSAPPASFVVLLLIIGFGIKLALPGLHLWLPQSYAVAPTAAVMVLSGAMIKAGLLGWLRFLPPGDVSLIDWGELLMVIGIIGIGFGAVFGLMQQRPRLLLGYSSISKMGVLTAGMGAALSWPAAAPAIISALVIFAAHHALVKAALFLGLGLVERGGLRPWLWPGFVFLALALAGAPFTSGALAKSMLSASLPQAAHQLLGLLALSAFVTTLLMARFLFLLWRLRERATTPHAVASTVAWLVLLEMIVVWPVMLADPGQLHAGIVPLSLGVLLAALALTATKRWPGIISFHNRRFTGRYLARQTSRGNLYLSCAAQLFISSMLSTLRKRYELILLILKRSQRASQPAQNSEHEWPLAGTLWLCIGGMLLAAFAATA